MHNGGGYKKYDTINVNGRNRVRFVKANSKSKNPILYIKSRNEYITYKSFLRLHKVKGGNPLYHELGPYAVTNFSYDAYQNLIDGLHEDGVRDHITSLYITVNYSDVAYKDVYGKDVAITFKDQWKNMKTLSFVEFMKEMNYANRNKKIKNIEITITVQTNDTNDTNDTKKLSFLSKVKSFFSFTKK